MNGPEHYREAEERLRASDYARQHGDHHAAMHEVAVAQVHATLAFVAAEASTIQYKIDPSGGFERGHMVGWESIVASTHDGPPTEVES